MKITNKLIGVFCLSMMLALASCQKDEINVDDATSSNQRIGNEQTVEYGIEEFDEEGLPLMAPQKESCKKREAKFNALLSDEEKTTLETYKSTLDEVKALKEAYFETLSEDMQEVMQSRLLSKEEHEAIKEAFDATLTADQIEALDYLKTLKDKYKPEKKQMHPKG